MRLLKTLLISLIFTGFAAGAEVRVVFKGASAGIFSADSVYRMTFGLTPAQTQKIADLTAGEVQFGDVYYVDINRKEISPLSRQPGFTGVIYPDVPPPVEQDHTRLKAGDPELVNQWWIEKLGVHKAWPMATGLGVVIADCDAGFYHDEQDLFSNMLLQHRYDLSDKDEPLVVNDGPFATHGTSVSAIMAGVFDGVGTNGIAYNSKIVPLQNFNYDSSDDLDKEEATAQCILKAISTPDVSIIVLENQTANGSSETFIGTRDAVRLAHQAGLIIVSAAGNYNAELIEEKLDDTGSIIVGALLKNDTVPYWSNFGERVTIAAYGEKLHTLSGPNGKFEDFGGTSGATPQVAATVAMMKEVQPLLTPVQAREILVQTRKTAPGTERVGGILTVPEAVELARKTPADFGSWNRQWFFRQQLNAILLNP